MGDKTGISWCDSTWNPVRGCSRVSEGCRNCYAEAVAARFSGPGQPYEGLARPGRKLDPVTNTYTLKDGARWTGEVRMVPEHLADPLRWKKPRSIFVNSMSDLFHEKLTNEQIDQVFAVMLLSPRHTFQVLTKRASRMREYMTDPALYDRVLRAAGVFRDERPELNQIAIDNPTTCPKPWIWLGVSVENQEAADERIPELLRTPAAVRFLSCEPLLGDVDARAYLSKGDYLVCPACRFASNAPSAVCANGHGRMVPDYGIGWVIAGCESGPRSRPCDVAWLRSLRDQCAAAGVPFFLKQAVAMLRLDRRNEPITFGEGSKGKGSVIELPYLDGVQHAQFPKVHP